MEVQVILSKEQEDELFNKLSQEMVKQIKKEMSNVPDLKYVNQKQLAKIFGMSENTIRSMRDEGMPCCRFGTAVRYELSAVDEWFRNYSK